MMLCATVDLPVRTSPMIAMLTSSSLSILSLMYSLNSLVMLIFNTSASGWTTSMVLRYIHLRMSTLVVMSEVLVIFFCVVAK